MTVHQGIAPAIANALSKRGYSDLTPVQTAMLDPAIGNADVLVSAQTGSGKTVAFGLALAPTLLGDAERFGHAATPLAVIVAPTRELALQVKREFEWLYEMTGALFGSCVGGMDMRTERRALERGAHIVVGTPGRLRDHITRGSLDMSDVRAVVLDEADEMLDLGFREDLEFILENAPEDRRTLMFSATVPKAIAKLAESYQKNAVRIETASERKQHADIEYQAMLVAQSDRENAIINVLRYHEAQTAIVFCSTRAAVNHMTARLNNRGFSVVALSGELSQNERTHALQAVRDGRARVLIATDVAARGIDLPSLELVIHADLPTNPDTLLHRSGRTGRAGRKGTSVLVVPAAARRKAERLLMNANVKAEWMRPPSADEVNRRDDERLVADPVFAEAIGEEEAALVATLIATHGADKLAAAFVRLYRGKRSAPEDLVEVPLQGRPGSSDRGPDRVLVPRDDFTDGRWFTLSVGRKKSAEPRWIIPLLCRAGGITKREIGAIRMREDETFVEIAGNCVDRFLRSIGPEGQLEAGISIRAIEGKPDMEQIRYQRPAEGEERPKRERWPLHEKPARNRSEGDRRDRPDRGPRAERPQGDRPRPERPRSGRPPEGSAPRADLEALDRDVWALGEGKQTKAPERDAKPDWKKKAPPYADKASGPAARDRKPHRKGGGAAAGFADAPSQDADVRRDDRAKAPYGKPKKAFAKAGPGAKAPGSDDRSSPPAYGGKKKPGKQNAKRRAE